jgi:hypothetical protein
MANRLRYPTENALFPQLRVNGPLGCQGFIKLGSLLLRPGAGETIEVIIFFCFWFSFLMRLTLSLQQAYDRLLMLVVVMDRNMQLRSKPMSERPVGERLTTVLGSNKVVLLGHVCHRMFWGHVD